jgi:rhodanese-related sulfurtransferase
MTPTIDRREIARRLDAGEPIVLVETLRAEHFDQAHLPGAIHLHYEEVEARAAALLPERDVLIVTYCSNPACANSRVAAERLAKLGYTNVRRYEAGKDDWIAAGLPVETGAVPV